MEYGANQAYDTPVIGDQARSQRSGSGGDAPEASSSVDSAHTALEQRRAVTAGLPPGVTVHGADGEELEGRQTRRSHSESSSSSCPATYSICSPTRPP